MLIAVIFLASLAIAKADDDLIASSKIIGGATTTISKYPFAVVTFVATDGVNFNFYAGGSIISTRSILTAGHCFEDNDTPENWRLRVGSSKRLSGGYMYNVSQILIHPNYSYADTVNLYHDVAIMRTATPIVYIPNQVQAAPFAAASYVLPDNVAVTVIGWGMTNTTDPTSNSDTLQAVQIYTINRKTCQEKYNGTKYIIADDMVCAGILNVGGKDSCNGDSGGAIIRYGKIVALVSSGIDCAQAQYPGINTLISVHAEWIQANK